MTDPRQSTWKITVRLNKDEVRATRTCGVDCVQTPARILVGSPRCGDTYTHAQPDNIDMGGLHALNLVIPNDVSEALAARGDEQCVLICECEEYVRCTWIS